jgi:hypothetical protein
MNLTEISVANITACLLGDDDSCTLHNDEFLCASQSSSGFYTAANGKFTISGIFSKGLRFDDSLYCGLNNFIVMTFVGEYVEWMSEVVAEGLRGEAEDLASNEREGRIERLENGAVEVFCDYKWNYEQ